ncbi:hypothetical protein KW842_02950 [Duganella sp. sic0402]|uniref:DUF5908 family protein n=1 Tax=Duganella sp. sic0402 TaxID=2854786 RepID=UPI001C48302B|nr:DUF5908 family protein [Duganella sp. sic0402]MBV7534716.1 hypothetical protein [Duganella sp. sic0402]
MSLNIGEIGVRVAVREPGETAAAARPADGCCDDAPISPSQQQALVSACVREVLQVLRRKAER